MRKRSVLLIALVVLLTWIGTSAIFANPFPKSWLWNSVALKMADTAKYKKAPPNTIGFSNASISNSWRVFMERQLKYGIQLHKDVVKNFYETDANDKPDKQIADVEDLIAKGVDLLIISPATSAALDPIVTRTMQSGIPVVCVDRRVSSDNFVSYVTASNVVQGRMQMLWLCETLKGKGNVIMLSGIAGSSPAEERIAGAREILTLFPDVKVLDLQYASWSPSEGKKIMAAEIQKFGKQINGVWGDGPQNAGAIDALHGANMKVPITADHYNGFLKRVPLWGYQSMSIDFPVQLGTDAVEIALKVLQGAAVPFIYEAPRNIITTKDTENVKADAAWKDVSRADAPDDSYPNSLPKELLPY